MSDLDESIPLTIKNFEDIVPDDLYLVGDAFLDKNGLIGHHINSANNFLSTGIKEIITNGFLINKTVINRRTNTEEDKSIERVEVIVKFTDVKILPPSTLMHSTGTETYLLPLVTSIKDKIYSGPLFISFTVEATAYLKNGDPIKRTASVSELKIAKIPIIKGSFLCHTSNMTREALMQMKEDPDDVGGYFIAKNDYAIDSTESTTFNQLKIYINEGYGKSRVRGDFLSKPGDGWQNSDMCILIFNTDDTFTLEISRDKLMEVKIPFYLLFRAMGWTNDKEIMDWIVYDYDSKANKNLLNSIIAAMNVKYGSKNYRDIYDQNDALREIVDLVPEENYKYLDLSNHPENYQNAIVDVLNTIDLHFLPHIGMTSEYRVDKMKFLALMIRKVFMVYLGYIPQTDRDSYRIKRVHAAGDNIAKTFKQIFNQTIAMPIKKQISKVFNSTTFSQVNLATMVKSAIYTEDFERLVVQTIVAGNKSNLKIKSRKVTNRLMAQLLHRKNMLNVIATMRQISSTSADSAKQSERAAEMRRVHMSALGYICVVHSPPEGEKVGINKQMAIFASIAPSSSSEVLKRIILEDKDVIKEETLSPTDIYKDNLAPVYVNGHLIAYTRDSIKLIDKYRKLRRQLKINPYTTIYWDNSQNEVLFFVDIGRMVRPLTIVYNNKRDPEIVKVEGEFYQGIAITKQDIAELYSKTKTIDHLIREQKVEFITPEEQQNILICPSLKKLYEEKNNDLKEYTHCDIPQAILGITALTAPFGNHNQATRITYQTSQAKQTCGYYVSNWPFRVDKEAFLQYINEMPLVKTAVNKYIFPNGNNLMVAFACYTGTNQEDSVLFNKSSVERGVFNGCKFDFEKTELDQKEELGIPNIGITEGIKDANYNKLSSEGVVPIGTRLKQNDVIIGKVTMIPKSQNIGSKYTYIDKSIVYKESEQAIIQNIIIDKNEDGAKFAKVGYRKIRPLAIGDKMCLTPDHDVLTSTGWRCISNLNKNDMIATLNSDRHKVEWHYVENINVYDIDEDIYSVTNDNIDIMTTMNHKFYYYYKGKYELQEASKLPEVYHLSTEFNIEYHDNTNFIYGSYCIPMQYWVEFVGYYILYGNIHNNSIVFNNANKISEVIARAWLTYSYNLSTNVITINDDIYEYLKNIPKNYLLYINTTLNKENSKILFNLVIKSDLNEPDLMQQLAMRAGYHLIYKNNKPIVEENLLHSVNKSDISIKKYKGKVYCPTVHNHIFMCRRNGKYCWTGNSSRAGQKGICAAQLNEADMLCTESGIRPDLVFNPFGIPSRMTCSQLIEALVSKVSAIKGGFCDGTIFKDIDIESYAQQLENYGYNRYGYERMINGFTGEYIDTLIFFGPVYYQRLQKFVADAEYSVRNALTDAITHQPLDGMASAGGLRIGEMESWVLESHGASMFIREKLFNHSDGYVEYICRCGKPAIVNNKEKIYKCKHCQDNADIVAIPTSWSSKLFCQEVQSCNVGIRRIPRPFSYEMNDNEFGEHSKFEEYSDETVKKLNIDDLIEDAGVENDY